MGERPKSARGDGDKRHPRPKSARADHRLAVSALAAPVARRNSRTLASPPSVSSLADDLSKDTRRSQYLSRDGLNQDTRRSSSMGIDAMADAASLAVDFSELGAIAVESGWVPTSAMETSDDESSCSTFVKKSPRRRLSIAERRAKGAADVGRRRTTRREFTVLGNKRAAPRRPSAMPDGVRELCTPLVPGAEHGAHRMSVVDFHARSQKALPPLEMPAFKKKTPDPLLDEMAKDRISVIVFRDGAKASAIEINLTYYRKEPQASWGEFTLKVEVGLGISRAEQIKLERDGVTVMRIASLIPNERYVVEPSAGDALLSTIVWGHDADLEALNARPRLKKSSYGGPSFANDFQVLCQTVTDAQRHLMKTLAEAKERGWEVDAETMDKYRLKFEEGSKPKAKAKARTRAEVLARQNREADRAEATRVALNAIKYLAQWKAKKVARFDACNDVNRYPAVYFTALDEIEVEKEKRSSEPLPRDAVRVLYRKAARWIAVQAVKIPSARPVTTAKSHERILRYLDPERGGPANRAGVLHDDLTALQYALCFFVNLANLVDRERPDLKHKLSALPLKAGGALLAMQVIHHRCTILSRATDRADSKLRHASAIARIAPRPSRYDYSMTLPTKPSFFHPHPKLVPMCLRIARAKRTTEDDSPSTTADHTRIHWWALCVVLALLRGEARAVALPLLVEHGHLVEALAQTLMRWNRFNSIVVILAWVLRELAMESEELREKLRSFGFYKLLKIAQTRHAEVADVYRDLQTVLTYLDTGSDEMAKENKIAEAIGDLELPLLDTDMSAYREFALHSDG